MERNICPAEGAHEPLRLLPRQLGVDRVAVPDQVRRRLGPETGEQLPRRRRAARRIDAQAHRVRRRAYPQPAARTVAALAARVHRPTRLVAVRHPRRRLPPGDRHRQRREQRREPGRAVRQGAGRDVEAVRRQHPRHRPQRAVVRVLLQQEQRSDAHPARRVLEQPRRRRGQRLAPRRTRARRAPPNPVHAAHMRAHLHLDQLRRRRAVRRIRPAAARTTPLRRLQRLLHRRQRRARRAPVRRRARLPTPRSSRARRRAAHASARPPPPFASPTVALLRQPAVARPKAVVAVLQFLDPRPQLRARVAQTARRPLQLPRRRGRPRPLQFRPRQPFPLPRPTVHRPPIVRRPTRFDAFPPKPRQLLPQRRASRARPAARHLRRRALRRRPFQTRQFEPDSHAAGIHQSAGCVQPPASHGYRTLTMEQTGLSVVAVGMGP